MDRTPAPTVSAKSRRRVAPWRPSLMAISEDVALFANGDATAKAAAGGGGGTRKASRAKAASGVGPRSFKNDYGSLFPFLEISLSRSNLVVDFVGCS